jgi:lipopolysaccharide transport system permease protein
MSDYEITLRPDGRWFDLQLAGLWQYRDLLTLLVWRDFIAKYKQTILGPLWFIVQPLLMTGVFVVVFGHLLGLSTDGLPPVLFYLCGQLGWNYFAQTVTANSSTLLANAGLFGKVYFPRLVVPVAALISNLLAFAIQLVTFLAFYVYLKGTPAAPSFGMTTSVVLLPLLIVQLAMLSLGVSLLMSAATAKYRDLTHVTGLLLQVWMYATPVLYPLTQFPARWQWVAGLNPMTPVVEAFRLMLLGAGTVQQPHVVWSVSCTVVVVVLGAALFSRVEQTFADIA